MSVPRARKRRKGFVLLVAAGVLIVLVAAAGAGWYFFGGLRPNRPDLIWHTVTAGTLKMSITERGTLESAHNEDVFCRVKTGSQGSSGLPQVKDVIPDGTLVKKGDLLIEIESSRFEDQLKDQDIKATQAESAWEQAEEDYKIQMSQNNSDIKTAELELMLAKLELKKYVEGDLPAAFQDIEYRRDNAEADLQMARDRAFWTELMVMKGYYTRTQAQAEQNKVSVARGTLAKAITDWQVLDKYTKVKEISTRENNVAEAERKLERVKTQAAAKLAQRDTDRKTKELVYWQEEKRYWEIFQEIQKCKIYAPQDGLVVYHTPESGGRSSNASRYTLGQGESVWEGQKLMRIPDLKHMIANTRVHEALISRVRVGQDALVRVDSFPDRKLKARVKSVSSVAAKQDYFSSSDVKVYTCLVEILDEMDGLRPDMSAQVTIFTDVSLEDVLTVPVQAIVGDVSMGRTRKVFVATPSGIEEREVVVGASNDTHVEIKEGLREGEQVLVNPRVLVGDKEKTRSAPAEGKSGEGKGGAGKGGDQGKGGAGGGKKGPPAGERPGN